MKALVLLLFAAMTLSACTSPKDAISPPVVTPDEALPRTDRARPGARTRPAPATNQAVSEPPSQGLTPTAKTPAASAYAAVEIGGRPEQDPAQTPAAPQAEGTVDLAPDAWDPTAFVRPIRRLNIDQIDAALEQASGLRLHQRLASRDYVTLFGKPDYLSSTQEDLRPSVVFTKLFQDIVYKHCWRVVYSEYRGQTPTPAFFVPAPARTPIVEADARAILAYLLLRWHSLVVTPESAEVDKWFQLLTRLDGVAGSSTEEAWQGVCVSLALHPRFYSL